MQLNRRSVLHGATGLSTLSQTAVPPSPPRHQMVAGSRCVSEVAAATAEAGASSVTAAPASNGFLAAPRAPSPRGQHRPLVRSLHSTTQGARRPPHPLPLPGPGFPLLPRQPGLTDWMSDIHMFNTASTRSFAPSGSSINAMAAALPKLVESLTRGLFKGDLERHWQSLLAYDGPQAIVT
jgi:hypothetical protein